MNANKRLEVALNSLRKARLYIENRNFGRAFAHYLVFLELQEAERKTHEEQFVEVLCIWGKLLEASGKLEDLCKCYLQGLNYFPINIEILNNFGAHLIRMFDYEEAEKHLRLADNISIDFLPAEKNLMTVKGKLVERWHFPMLNDLERNMAYYKAILSYSAQTNATVIDIGTGCGLLSLFASNNENVTSIHAIEASKTLSSIAGHVFNANNMLKIQLHNEYSTNLSSSNLNGHANLLITEIFDVGLFGEQALESLIHAWENLLDKEAKIIPASATLYVVGIECTDILKEYKLINQHQELNFGACVHSNTNEPYDSKNLKLLNYTQLTETVVALNVDFANLAQLKNLQLGDYSNLQTLKVINAGRLDAFAIWFDLKLDDNNIITTDPAKENVKCWEQAVIYVDHPYNCNIDLDIQVKMQCHDGRLQVKLCNEQETSEQCFRVQPDTLALLNDDILISILDKLYDSTVHDKVILDLFAFPLLGLRYAKTGNKCYCMVEGDENEVFLEYICDLNHICKDNVFNLKKKDFCDSILPNDLFSFDIILSNLVDMKGTIDESCMRYFKQYRSWLKPGGVIYPKTMNLCCQLVESDYLRNFNIVTDENLFGFHIANYINEYAVNEHFDLEKNFQHKKLGMPQFLGNLLIESDYYLLRQEIPTPQASNIDGILYWFEIILSDELKIDTSVCAYYNYACFLLDRHRKLQEKSELTLNMKHHKGLLKMHFN